MAVDHQISIHADLLARNPRLGPDWSNSKACQDLLSLEYRRTVHSGIPLPALADTGFRVFSQNDEDGHLHHIFSVIGAETRKSAEICCGGCFLRRSSMGDGTGGSHNWYYYHYY